ncbi:hypothetical protein, partial [Burkholderia ubonensis]|uniref:hypothetical protein n=1 Tax=Burkholderia ubonensis TaxID=101571 RepID=UPI001E39AB70
DLQIPQHHFGLTALPHKLLRIVQGRLLSLVSRIVQDVRNEFAVRAVGLSLGFAPIEINNEIYSVRQPGSLRKRPEDSLGRTGESKR